MWKFKYIFKRAKTSIRRTNKKDTREEHIDSRKMEIDSLLEKYKTIDKEKEEELNKNIEDKRREEEHIKLNEEEKKYLQL